MSEISVLAGSMFILIFLSLIFLSMGQTQCQEDVVLLQKAGNVTRQNEYVSGVIGMTNGTLSAIPIVNFAAGPIVNFMTFITSPLNIPLNAAGYVVGLVGFLLSPCLTEMSYGVNLLLIPIITIIIFLIVKIVGPLVVRMINGLLVFIAGLIPG